MLFYKLFHGMSTLMIILHLFIFNITKVIIEILNIRHNNIQNLSTSYHKQLVVIKLQKDESHSWQLSK